MKTEYERLQKRLTNKPLLDKIAEGDNLFKSNKLEEAIEVFKEVLAKIEKSYEFDICELNRKIGNCYYNLKNRDQARFYYEETLKYCTTNASIYSMLGYLCYYYDNEKSISYYAKALSLKPIPTCVSTICLTMLKSDKYSQKTVKEAIENQINKYRPFVLKDDKPFEYNGEKDPNKKLNIGYLSSDFYSHAMMQFVLPLLEYHNQKKFNFTLYSCSKKSDSTTARIKAVGMKFVDCSDLNEKELAQKIHDDEIDILVDLGGYTHCRCFSLFYKPAPIIMQYLGFVNTMGMKEVDYIFADEFVIPKKTAKYYTEKPMYLKSGMHRFDYNNSRILLPEINELPYYENGYITFGSFNCPSKINDYTLSLWANVLQNVSNSKLLIYRTQMSDGIILKFKKKFSELGIPENRVIYRNEPVNGMHFNAYKLVDIALDTTPFNGLTITIEQISMGIPVITLAGESMQSRGCAHINKVLKLNDLIAEDEGEYIAKAKKLASDIKKLDYYRHNLRDILNKSPLRSDPESFVKCVEDGYTKAWKDYCKSL